MYVETIPTLLKFLANLEAWLDESVAHAEHRGFDPEVLVECRLAPDMFPLRRQVQSACDAAKFLGARLSNTPAPVHEDSERTLAELRARIAKTRTFLEGLAEGDFDEAASRVVKVGFLPPGTGLTGAGYGRGFGLPNFFFHVNMAYAILRHNGVPLGKRAYIGGLDLIPAESPA